MSLPRQKRVSSEDHTVKINRRRLLQAVGATALPTLTSCGRDGNTTTPTPSTRPNVLFISIDDLNDWVGFLGGHPQVMTPNLDKLAARSTVFERAYCTAPLCSPSRAGALSGLSVQSTQVYDNKATFRSVNPNKPQVDDALAGQGYKTARFGKIDHLYQEVEQPMSPPQPDAPYSNPYCPLQKGLGGLDWGPAPGGDEVQPDYVYAQQGIDFINAYQKNSSQPFFLSVGFVRAHFGWWLPQRFFDMYPAIDKIHLPYVYAQDLDDLGSRGRSIALDLNVHACMTAHDGLWASAVRAYLASITWVDTQVGRLLDALEASPHANNTVIVLWSDQGNHLGEKLHWNKLALWEHATRVPFVISLPKQNQTQRVSFPVSLRDMVPTIYEMCQAQAPYPMDGRSLVPLLQDPSKTWDYPVLTTLNQHDHAIRTRDWRYIRYINNERELYDERSDSEELYNLAADPAYATLIAELDSLMPPPV